MCARRLTRASARSSTSGGSAVPSVGGDDHHGTAQRAAVRCGQQPTHASAEVCTAVAVDHFRVGPGERHFRRAMRQRRREPRQRCRKCEDLGPNALLAQGRCPHQMQIDRRIGPHRSADIAHQDDPAWPMAPAGALQPQHLPACRPATTASTPARRFACRGDAAPGASCAAAATAQTAAPARCRCGADRPRRTDRTTRRPCATSRLGSASGTTIPPSENSAALIMAGIVVHGRPSPSLPPPSRSADAWCRSGGRTGPAVLGWIRRPRHRVGEDRIEHRVECGHVLRPVHQCQAGRPVQGGARLRRDVVHRLYEGRGPIGRHHNAASAQFGHQRNREGGDVDTAQ